MQTIYKVILTADEQTSLTQLISTSKNNAQKIKHANILLTVDETEIPIVGLGFVFICNQS